MWVPLPPPRRRVHYNVSGWSARVVGKSLSNNPSSRRHIISKENNFINYIGHDCDEI